LLSGGGISQLKTGDWLTVLCAAIWAIQVVLIARYATSTGRPIALAVSQFAVCSLFGLVGAAAYEPIDIAAIGRALPEILYSGIFSGGIAFTLQAVGQRYTSSSQAAIFLSSEAVFAAIFGAWFLGERIGAMGYAGCALIFAAIIAVEALPPLFTRRARA
jgi:drug/metabolite transporter (DMT)-like permease